PCAKAAHAHAVMSATTHAAPARSSREPIMISSRGIERSRLSHACGAPNRCSGECRTSTTGRYRTIGVRMPSDRSYSFTLRPPRAVLLALFWTAAVTVGAFALMPITIHLPSTGWDKANHALAFAILAWLGVPCWPQRRAQVLVALAAYGGAIEIAQLFTDTH